jgi:hypothetical protein
MAQLENKIKFSIIVDDGEVKVKLTQLDNSVKKVKDSFSSSTISIDKFGEKIKSLNGKLQVSEAQLKKEISQLQKLKQSAAIGSKEYQNLGNGINQLTAQLNGSSAATGGMTASALELGRVVSDMPYGIRGVANNLSQLGSNLFFAARQAGGMTKAIQGLFMALRGPLGILLAFQAVIAAVDFFSARQKKAKEDVDELTISIDKQTNRLGILQGLLTEKISQGAFGSKEFNENIEVLVNKFSEFGKKYNTLTDEQKKDEKFVRNLVESYQALLATRNKIKTTEKEIGELVQEGAGAYEDIYEKAEAEERYKEQLSLLREQLEMLYSHELQYEKVFKVLENKGTGAIKAYKQQFIDLTEEIRSFSEREETALEQSESDLNEIKRRYEREELEAKYNEFVAKQNLRLREYKERVKGAENANELILKAQNKHDESLKLAKVEYGNAINALDSAQFNERLANIRDFNEERERLALENRRKLEDIEFGEESMARQQKPFTTGKRGEAALGAQKDAQTGLEISSEAALAINSIEAELQADILSNEKKAELLLEKEQREKDFLRGAEMRSKALITLDRIELESKRQAAADGAALLNSASQLAGKSTKAGKALAVASTTISTYSATQRAYESQIIPGDPTSVPRAVLAGAAALAAGLARVKQILAVKIPGGSGGGSAPSGGGRTFDFNLVGSTGQDQLAQAVGSQFNQGPIQSYVVSSQITSQQQLDNIIESDATFGGDN